MRSDDPQSEGQDPSVGEAGGRFALPALFAQISETRAAPVAISTALEISPRGSTASTSPIGQMATVRVTTYAAIRNKVKRSHATSNREERWGMRTPRTIWTGDTTSKKRAAYVEEIRCSLKASRWIAPS